MIVCLCTQQVPGFVSCYDGNLVHKLVDIKGFSIYWDSPAKLIGSPLFSDLEVLRLLKLMLHCKCKCYSVLTCIVTIKIVCQEHGKKKSSGRKMTKEMSFKITFKRMLA